VQMPSPARGAQEPDHHHGTEQPPDETRAVAMETRTARSDVTRVIGTIQCAAPGRCDLEGPLDRRETEMGRP
jgi:hypothetical protein